MFVKIRFTDVNNTSKEKELSLKRQVMILQPSPMTRRDIKHMPRPTVHLTSHLLKPL